MSKPLLSLICAMDNNRLIGSDNALPWRLPADLAFFRKTTMGKPVIMGRKTFSSIGRALPGRQNIVVTRNASFQAEGCDIAAGIDQAMALTQGHDEAMLIGGASLYEQTLGTADSIYLTLIHHEFKGDTWFPELDSSMWRCVERQDFDPDAKNSYAYSFIKFVRDIR